MKKYYTFLLIIIIALVSCTDKTKESRKSFAEGIDLFYKSKYTAAIEKFTIAIEYRPQYPEAYYFRGMARFNTGQNDKSIEDLDMAIKIWPEYADAYSSKGDILELMKKHDEACECWRKARDLGKPNLRDKLRRCF